MNGPVFGNGVLCLALPTACPVRAGELETVPLLFSVERFVAHPSAIAALVAVCGASSLLISFSLSGTTGWGGEGLLLLPLPGPQ